MLKLSCSWRRRRWARACWRGSPKTGPLSLRVMTWRAPRAGTRTPAGILTGDAHAGAIYNATGPERLSVAERARLIAEITGRPLAFRVITEAQLRAGLTQAGLPPGAVDTVTGIQASFAAGAFDIVTGDVERLGGRPPRPLRDVLAAALKPRAV